MPLEIAARSSPESNEVAAAEAARSDNRVEDSIHIYQRLSAETNDARTQQFIRNRLASLQVEQKLKLGEWVDFLPKDTDDLNWSTEYCRWSVLPDDGVEIRSGLYGSLFASRVRVGANMEIKGQIELRRGRPQDFQAGVGIGWPVLGTDHWYSFQMRRKSGEEDVVSFSRGWGIDGTVKPFPLKDATNTFDFRLRNGKATALVNGQHVFADVPCPGAIPVADPQFSLGLFGYSTTTNSVIRYRNVEVRRLPANL
jgi:hypothetical protein